MSPTTIEAGAVALAAFGVKIEDRVFIGQVGREEREQGWCVGSIGRPQTQGFSWVILFPSTPASPRGTWGLWTPSIGAP